MLEQGQTLWVPRLSDPYASYEMEYQIFTMPRKNWLFELGMSHHSEVQPYALLPSRFGETTSLLTYTACDCTL